MGAIVVLAVAALITIGLGFETVVVAVGVAFVFAAAFSSFTDKYYPSLLWRGWLILQQVFCQF